MIYHNEKYRVKRSKLQEEKMRFLIDNKIFAGYADILALSSIIGYNHNQFVKIDLQASDPVQLNFFSSDDRVMINLIAYAHKGDQSVIDPNSVEKYSIYESYANGGFPILWDFLNLNLEKGIDDIVEVFDKISLGLRTDFSIKTDNIIEEMIS